MKKVLILAATVAAALSVGVATSAATPQTPTGLCGAANMTNTNALPGMLNAMFGNGAGAGNGQMFNAVDLTSCS